MGLAKRAVVGATVKSSVLRFVLLHWKSLLVTIVTVTLAVMVAFGSVLVTSLLQQRDAHYVQPGSYTVSKLVDLGFLSESDRAGIIDSGGVEVPWQIVEVLATKKRSATTVGSDGLSGEVPEEFREIIVKSAGQCAQLSPALLAAQVWAESGWKSTATSSVGARGIAQFMPETWKQYGRDGDGDGKADIDNPQDSIMGQGNYMCYLLTDRVPAVKKANPEGTEGFSDEKLALLMYNGGFNGVTPRPDYCNNGATAGYCEGTSAGDYADKILAAVPRFQGTGMLVAGSGKWVAPITGFPLVSPYGPRDLLGMSFHDGVDFGAPCGQTYYAAADGVVTFAGMMPGFGGFGAYGTISINHGGGIYTQYVHSDRDDFLVKAGDRVVAGQPIGKVNTTGASTGCHLHYEIRQGVTDGTKTAYSFASTDPEPFMLERGVDLREAANGKPQQGQVTLTGDMKPYQWALQQVGKRYVWGAVGPDTFDCSGLVGSAFLNTVGKKKDFWGVKASSDGAFLRVFNTVSFMEKAQEMGFVKVDWKEGDGEKNLQPGDVMVNGAHIGFYIGNGKQVHAANPLQGVRVDPLQGDWGQAWRFEGANGPAMDSRGVTRTASVGVGYSLPEFEGGVGAYHLDVDEVKKLNEAAKQAENDSYDFAARIGRYAMASSFYSTDVFNIDAGVADDARMGYPATPNNTITGTGAIFNGFHMKFYVNHAVGQVAATPAEDTFRSLVVQGFVNNPQVGAMLSVYESVANKAGVDGSMLSFLAGDSTASGLLLGQDPNTLCSGRVNVAGADVVDDVLCETTDSELDLFKYMFTKHEYPAVDVVRDGKQVHLDAYTFGVDFGDTASRLHMEHVNKVFDKWGRLDVKKQDKGAQKALESACLEGQSADLSSVKLTGKWASPTAKTALISDTNLFDGTFDSNGLKVFEGDVPARDTFYTCSAFYDVEEMMPTVSQNYAKWYAGLTSLDRLDDIYAEKATDIDGGVINLDGVSVYGEGVGKTGKAFWEWVEDMCRVAQKVIDDEMNAEINLQKKRKMMQECYLEVDEDGNITDDFTVQTNYVKKCLNAYITDSDGTWIEDHRLAYDVVPDANGEAAIARDASVKPLQAVQRAGWVRAIKALPMGGMTGEKAGKVYDIAKKWGMGNVSDVAGGAGVADCTASTVNEDAGTSGDPGGEFGVFTVAQRKVSDDVLKYARDKKMSLSVQKLLIGAMLADGTFNREIIKGWVDGLGSNLDKATSDDMEEASGVKKTKIDKFATEATNVLNGYSGGTLACSTGTTATLSGTDPESAKAYAKSKLGEFGWDESEFVSLEKLWTRESGWNYRAKNSSSGAYGIPQSLPASKMESEGADWETNPATQIDWGLKYIKNRYGSPSAAWAHSEQTGWY